MTIDEAKKKIKDSGIKMFDSIKKGYILWQPANDDDLPKGLSPLKNRKEQTYGTHYTVAGVIDFATKLKI